jgi:predicted CopG family antitoxin
METQEQTTTMEIKHSTWEELNKRKKVGESFDDVIKRILLEEPEVKRKKQ